MKKNTHKKKSYSAECHQWDGKNTEKIIQILKDSNCHAEMFRDQLILRWQEKGHSPSIDTMSIGYWLRLGENEELKVYSPEKFPTRYDEI